MQKDYLRQLTDPNRIEAQAQIQIAWEITRVFLSILP